MKKSILALVSLTLLMGHGQAQLPPGDGPATVTGTVLEPTPTPFSDALLQQLKLPAGFQVTVFARDLGNARMMQVMPNGDIYLSRRKQGDILLLRDSNKDGVADVRKVVAQNIQYIHGLALQGRKLYMVSDRKVLVADIQADGALSTPRVIIDDLPDAGQHPNRTLAFGPDGLLYITVGSTCNNCLETNPESATIVRSLPDGSARTVYAKGLRNTIGFGWHPVSRQMYGFDHGSDWRGDDQPSEELNLIQQNKHYGWPFCFENKQVDVFQNQDPPNTSKADFCLITEPPALTYTAHAAPIGMVFYTKNQFPAEYKNDAFVAFRGSWNRSEPAGYKVVRVRFDRSGKPTGFEDFMTGWLISPPQNFTEAGAAPTENEQKEATRPAQFGRIAGLAVWNDGSLLISEDQNGVIYRVRYQGGK